MNQDELVALRAKILGDLTPLAIDGVENTPDRFNLLLRIIQSGNADKNVYDKAYDLARTIEDKDQKLEALMSLIDEIDFDIQSKEEQTPSQPAVEQPQDNQSTT